MKCGKNGGKRIAAALYCTICLWLLTAPIDMKAARNGNVIEGAGDTAPPVIAGESGIVMEVSTGTVLYEKNMHAVHYPASITKVMTALLVIENCEMDEIVTVPPEAVYMEDKGSHIALDEGEQLTVEQCLYAVMLASANDAAYALAVHAGGTIENFIDMMNKKARELGCLNTNFTNPHGLPDENHVTSAYDMALITRAALEYEMFRTAAGETYYEIPPSEYQKDLICMYNHHKMLGKNEYADEEVFAGKNGYTDDALNTLVTCARRGDMEIVCVVMRDGGSQIYEDTKAMIDYGLDNFSKIKIDEDRISFAEKLRNENPAFEGRTVVSFDEDVYAVVPVGATADDLEIKLDYDEALENVAVTYSYRGCAVGGADLKIAAMPPSVKLEGDSVFPGKTGGSWWQIILRWMITIVGVLAGAFLLAVGLRLLQKKLYRRAGRNRYRRGGRNSRQNAGWRGPRKRARRKRRRSRRETWLD